MSTGKCLRLLLLFCGNLITENRVLVFKDETSAENWKLFQKSKRARHDIFN